MQSKRGTHATPVELASLLPVIRVTRAARATTLDTRQEVLAVYEDVIVFFAKEKKNRLPGEAFNPGGTSSLLNTKSRGEKLQIPVEDVGKVEVSETHLFGNPLTQGRERGRQIRITRRDGPFVDVWLAETDAVRVVEALDRLVGIEVRPPPLPESSAKQLGPKRYSPTSRALLVMFPVGALMAALTDFDAATIVVTLPLAFVGLLTPVAALLLIVISALLNPPTKRHAKRRKVFAAKLRAALARTQPLRSWVFGTVLRVVAVPLLLFGVFLQIALSGERDMGPLVRLFGWVLLLPAAGIAYYGHRLAAPRAAQVLEDDERPPVVYLRSFAADDTGTYNPDGFTARALGLRPILPEGLGPFSNPLFGRICRLILGRPGDVAEEQLAHGLRDYGPFVAIGRPGELLPSGGAARMYVGDDDWRDVAIELIQSARLVVLEAGLGENLMWELEQACRYNMANLLISLRACNGDQALYDEFRHQAEAISGVALPRMLDSAAFIAFTGSESFLLPFHERPAAHWPLSSCAVDFDATLAPIREPVTQPPRNLRGTESTAGGRFFAVVAWNVAWPLILGVLLIALD